MTSDLQGRVPALLIAFGYAGALVAFLRTAWHIRDRHVDAVGRYPVPAPLFWLAKLAIVVPLVVLARAVVRTLAGAPSPPLAAAWASAALFTLGAGVAVAAFGELDTDTRTGLAREATTLRTGGIYGVSRNPMYLAIVILHLAAVVAVPSLWTAIPLVVAAVIHDRIVRAEERFLAERFGLAYRTYHGRVRRYL